MVIFESSIFEFSMWWRIAWIVWVWWGVGAGFLFHDFSVVCDGSAGLVFVGFSGAGIALCALGELLLGSATSGSVLMVRGR